MTTDQLKARLKGVAWRLGFAVTRASDPKLHFHSHPYLRHNARRLEHLASLRLPVAERTVLEVGAGIGDHSHYYLDRGCEVTITDARPDNVDYLRFRYRDQDIRSYDVENLSLLAGSPFEIVHCYGLLYHLRNPKDALQCLSRQCSELLILETCVALRSDDEINLEQEDRRNPTMSFSGVGCRPTRPWLFAALQELFEYVYCPRTQPNHEEFPLDWTVVEHTARFQRAVFVGSRQPLNSDVLLTDLPEQQIRHE